jgi:hypothetical protein
MHTGGSVASFEDLTDQADTYAARTVDGLIASLEAIHQHAIHTAWLGERWRYPDEPLELVYDEARQKLEPGLTRWGLA